MLRPISKADFDRALKRDVYYAGRWSYFSEVLWLARRIRPNSVLELGPHTLPLFPAGDTLDRRASVSPTYLHDARRTPWPVDRRYDLLIGLQVWEHLGPHQTAAFREMRRVADHVMLSVPFLWHAPHDPEHGGIDHQTVLRWSGGVPPKATVLANYYGTRRLVCWWHPD